MVLSVYACMYTGLGVVSSVKCLRGSINFRSSEGSCLLVDGWSRDLADAFGLVMLRRTVSLVFDILWQSGVIYNMTHLGWGLIRNPQVAKKGNF